MLSAKAANNIWRPKAFRVETRNSQFYFSLRRKPDAYLSSETIVREPSQEAILVSVCGAHTLFLMVPHVKMGQCPVELFSVDSMCACLLVRVAINCCIFDPEFSHCFENLSFQTIEARWIKTGAKNIVYPF